MSTQRSVVLGCARPPPPAAHRRESEFFKLFSMAIKACWGFILAGDFRFFDAAAVLLCIQLIYFMVRDLLNYYVKQCHTEHFIFYLVHGNVNR